MTELLDRVFHRHTGEIWLYDNDLLVFERDDAFKKLYKERIDGCWSDRVLSIKLLLRKPVFDRFLSSGVIRNNLATLRPDRIRAIHIGCIDRNLKPTPPDGLLIPTAAMKGTCHPWIIYNGGDQQLFDNSVIILRPPAFPFYDVHDTPPISSRSFPPTVVAWSTDDDHLKLVSRKVYGWFTAAFHKNASQNFKAVEPHYFKSTSLQGLTLVRHRKEEELRTLSLGLTATKPQPVLPPIDVGIVTTTPAEYNAVCKCFKLTPSAYGARGWIRPKDVSSLSIICVRSSRQGSVSAAITARELVSNWKPRLLFLIGICGAFVKETAVPGKRAQVQDRPKFKYDAREDTYFGDVLIASKIVAYEYQKLETVIVKKVKKEKKRFEAFTSEPDSDLLKMATEFAGSWRYKGPLVEGYYAPEYGLPSNRLPKARVTDFACGCKVVTAGFPWLSDAREALGARKVDAVEMEGEGVGSVVKEADYHIAFLMMKGISDFANFEKDDDFHPHASTTSAVFLKDFIHSRHFRVFFDQRFESKRPEGALFGFRVGWPLSV